MVMFQAVDCGCGLRGLAVVEEEEAGVASSSRRLLPHFSTA